MPTPVNTGLARATPTTGVLQVETAIIVGTITGSGNATITVTAAGLAGSPLAVSVAVLNGDTASQVAAKVIAQLQITAAITAMFTVGGTGATVVLTTIKCAANDTTMNIASANGTCTGLTAAPTSVHTTAGVLGSYRGVETGMLCVDNTTAPGVVYQNTGTPNC